MKNFILWTVTNHGHAFQFDDKQEAIDCAMKRRKRAKYGYQVAEKINETEQFAEYQICFDTEQEDFVKHIFRIYKRKGE